MQWNITESDFVQDNGTCMAWYVQGWSNVTINKQTVSCVYYKICTSITLNNRILFFFVLYFTLHFFMLFYMHKKWQGNKCIYRCIYIYIYVCMYVWMYVLYVDKINHDASTLLHTVTKNKNINTCTCATTYMHTHIYIYI